MNNLPYAAYVVVEGNAPGKRIGIVKRGESGYYPAVGYDEPEVGLAAVRLLVKSLNDRMGIDADTAERMQVGSMFGWDVPFVTRGSE